MLSRKQKRVVRYVEEGSLLKLKSYLRKHADLEINFSHGKKRRSPLHLVCAIGDDAILRLLLKHGADPLQKDRNGDTPLHLAVKRALKHGKRDYDDLVVPLRKNCPAAMDTSNKTGITPQDLLEGLRFKQGSAVRGDGPRHLDPDQEWREKLMGECQDEFSETFGQYDDDFGWADEEEEDFGDWAERIRQEYVARQHAQAQAATASRRKKKKGRTEKEEKDERSDRELRARLEREHAEYLKRAARKEEETKLSKKLRYEEHYAATFSTGSASDRFLNYSDIPWPAPQGSVEEMVAVMLHGADRTDVPAFRKLLRRQQTLWHPDKFAQRCSGRLGEKDRQRILDTVTALSQELNRLAQSLR